MLYIYALGFAPVNSIIISEPLLLNRIRISRGISRCMQSFCNYRDAASFLCRQLKTQLPMWHNVNFQTLDDKKKVRNFVSRPNRIRNPNSKA
jgi:hypothetical protein